MNRLLDKNKDTRLGSNGNDFHEIIAHPFFADIDVDALVNRQLVPPLNVREFFNDESGFNTAGFN